MSMVREECPLLPCVKIRSEISRITREVEGLKWQFLEINMIFVCFDWMQLFKAIRNGHPTEMHALCVEVGVGGKQEEKMQK